MSEKEKMLSGELYNANYDEELIKERDTAKDLCFEFNNLKPSDREEQRKILEKLIITALEKIQFPQRREFYLIEIKI